jgi:hypothetical protein
MTAASKAGAGEEAVRPVFSLRLVWVPPPLLRALALLPRLPPELLSLPPRPELQALVLLPSELRRLRLLLLQLLSQRSSCASLRGALFSLRASRPWLRLRELALQVRQQLPEPLVPAQERLQPPRPLWPLLLRRSFCAWPQDGPVSLRVSAAWVVRRRPVLVCQTCRSLFTFKRTLSAAAAIKPARTSRRMKRLPCVLNRSSE